MSFSVKNYLHHTCSKTQSSAKQQNPEEKLTRQIVIIYATLNRSSLLMGILSKSYNRSTSIHYTPICIEISGKIYL